MTRLAPALLALVVGASPAFAQSASDAVSATLRPGWRMADGTHVAALHLRLAPGWKTYWRAPGDAGIPPRFDWSGSSNAGAVAVTWPTPHVFRQSGMRSVGYKNEVVLPLTVATRAPGDVRIEGEIEMGVCEDICLPATLKVSGTLPSGSKKADPVIAAAMADRPFSAAEAGVRGVRCSLSQTGGDIALVAEVDMPAIGGVEETVIETSNPHIWVAEPDTSRRGGTLFAETRLVHVDDAPFAVDRSGIRITVLSEGQAVDIQGCAG